MKSAPGPLRLAFRAGLALAAILAVAFTWVMFTYAGPGPKAREGAATVVTLDRGAGVAGVAEELARAGVIRSKAVFMAMARLTGAARRLQAGEYEFRSGVSMARVMSDVHEGRVVRRFVTVPEGWTSAMAVEAVMRSPVLVGEVEPPPEGSLLPDTYQIRRGETRQSVIDRMRRAQDAVLQELWPKRASDLPFSTPAEALTLASIVEKETGVAAERPRVAAVFVNRLRQGMRLESDPTIIYGISKGRPLGRGLTVSEIAEATPYNTYQIGGLPPSPIANPGRAAIAAVLNPPTTNELFFVADGTGGHAFAATYEEHQRNVARWREIERSRAAGDR